MRTKANDAARKREDNFYGACECLCRSLPVMLGVFVAGSGVWLLAVLVIGGLK